MTNDPDRFTRAAAIVLRHEGGYGDDPADPGGATNHGVSIRFAGSIGLDVDGDGDTDQADIVALTRDQALAIYRKHFWDRCRCDDLPPGLALAVFDCAVNQGPGTAARLLQRAVGRIPVDGVIGPVTLAAIARDPARLALLRDFMARRAKRYADTKGVDRFGRGWFGRLLAIHEIATRQVVRS